MRRATGYPEAVPRLILASASARRKEILSALGLRFEARPAEVDERVQPGESAFDAAERLACEKAAAVAAAEEDALVVAADTIVVLDGDALGKPRDRSDAEAMLHRLQGRRHQVVTGVAVAWGGGILSGRETTTVVFTPMSEAEIRAYAATGEPDDKAGAYAVQGIGGLFVERVEGSPSNVVGLPVRLLARLLAAAGLSWPAGR
jgi:septum formation protein